MKTEISCNHFKLQKVRYQQIFFSHKTFKTIILVILQARLIMDLKHSRGGYCKNKIYFTIYVSLQHNTDSLTQQKYDVYMHISCICITIFDYKSISYFCELVPGNNKQHTAYNLYKILCTFVSALSCPGVCEGQGLRAVYKVFKHITICLTTSLPGQANVPIPTNNKAKSTSFTLAFRRNKKKCN